jgi:predicted acylesterase/phospholipase RssA
VVCLAVEGGGMRGAVPAGMCLVLEEAGLIPSFDRIYGQREAELRVLAGFAGAADALAVVRASCTIPLLAGVPPSYRGEPLVDGGLLEPIPYRTARREGASHVLVLRSRPAAFRTRTRMRPTELAVALYGEPVRVRPRPAPYPAAGRGVAIGVGYASE